MHISSLSITLTQDSVSRFTTLLQGGIIYEVMQGQTIGAYLLQLPGVTEDFIINEIQTLFLNGNPIDDLETVFAEDNSTLALSAAMPGLAGAIFRRNSLHASLRGKTSKPTVTLNENQPLKMYLKLFNSVATQIGPRLFQHGVTVKADKLHSFLMSRSTLLNTILATETDTTTLPKESLLSYISQQKEILLILKENDDRSK